jgi:hypothetical protein
MHMQRKGTSTISTKELFPAETEELRQLAENSRKGSMKGRMSVRLQWMNEFSDMGFETQIRKALFLARGKSNFLNHDALHIEPDAESMGHYSSGSKSSRPVSAYARSSRRVCRNDSVHPSDYTKYEKQLENADQLSFNIFDFSNEVGRGRALPLLIRDSLH